MPLALKNAFRNKTRTVFTTLSVAGSFCMLGVLMAVYHLFFVRAAPPGQALRLIVRNRISFTTPIPVSYAARIQSVPGVRTVMKYQWFGGTYKDSRDPRNSFSRFAVEGPKLFTVHPEYSIAPDELRAFLRERDSCILGRPLAERLGVHAGSHIVLVGDIFPVTLDLVVRGFYDSAQDNESLYFHFDYLNESAFGSRWDSISMLVVLLDRPESAAPVARSIDALFRNSPNQTKTETEKSLVLGFLGYIGNVKLFLLALSGALSLATLFVTANTIAMSVRERAAEVGVLKTLGFTRGFVLRLFVVESATIALTGGVLGLAAAEAIAGVLRHIPILFVDLKALTLGPALLALALAGAAALGVLSAALPAWSASGRDIRDCLSAAD